MGELVRLALVKFTKMGLLFGGQGSDLLFQRGSFYTKYVSEIESDKQGDYTSCMEVLEELGKLPLPRSRSSQKYLFLAMINIIMRQVYRLATHIRSLGLGKL